MRPNSNPDTAGAAGYSQHAALSIARSVLAAAEPVAVMRSGILSRPGATNLVSFDLPSPQRFVATKDLVATATNGKLIEDRDVFAVWAERVDGLL
jgi:hypothetical protein